MKLVRLSLLVGLALTCVSASWACTCGMSRPPGCAVYSKNDAVFVGLVLEIQEDESRGPSVAGASSFTAIRPGARVARLAVQERFRGAAGETVEVVTGRGDGDCGVPFLLG